VLGLAETRAWLTGVQHEIRCLFFAGVYKVPRAGSMRFDVYFAGICFFSFLFSFFFFLFVFALAFAFIEKELWYGYTDWMAGSLGQDSGMGCYLDGAFWSEKWL
jgi:hypothetical protein